MSRQQLDESGIAELISTLSRRGYSVLGPRVVGAVVSFQPITATDDLPRGVRSEQSAGRYRLARGDDDVLFAYGPAVESLKRYLCPPTETLWVAARQNGSLRFEATHSEPPRLAFVGVRPCDLAAIARLDEVFLRAGTADPYYRARRERLFLVAVNCTEPAGTCFCASMGTGPAASSNCDLAITELSGGRFVVEVHSDAGADVMTAIGAADASGPLLDEEGALLTHAAGHMGRQVNTDGLPQLLMQAFARSEWDDVARRCLACANCTASCPTCFCHTIDDRTSLSGDRVERERRWDSCFGADFSYIHGGSIRPSVAARYRQFVTHKFSAWIEQFGTFGCVGCGRCITWCPGGIDVTEELRRMTAPSAQS